MTPPVTGGAGAQGVKQRLGVGVEQRRLQRGDGVFVYLLHSPRYLGSVAAGVLDEREAPGSRHVVDHCRGQQPLVRSRALVYTEWYVRKSRNHPVEVIVPSLVRGVFYVETVAYQN